MYQALYRKYRSQTFGEMVGQKVISTTLRQAVEAGENQCGENLCQGYELS